MSATYRLIGERRLRKYAESTPSPVYATESEVSFISSHLCDVPWTSANGVRDARMTWHTSEVVYTEGEEPNVRTWTGLQMNPRIRDEFDAALFCSDHVGGAHRAHANAACYRYVLPDAAVGKTLESVVASVTSDPYNAVGARLALLTNTSGEIPTDCATCRNGGRLVDGSYVHDASYHTPDGGVVKRRVETAADGSQTWYPKTEDVTLEPAGFVLQKYLFVFVLLENYNFSRGNWIEGSSFIENRISVVLDEAVDGWTEGDTVDLAPESSGTRILSGGRLPEIDVLTCSQSVTRSYLASSPVNDVCQPAGMPYRVASGTTRAQLFAFPFGGLLADTATGKWVVSSVFERDIVDPGTKTGVFPVSGPPQLLHPLADDRSTAATIGYGVNNPFPTFNSQIEYAERPDPTLGKYDFVRYSEASEPAFATLGIPPPTTDPIRMNAEGTELAYEGPGHVLYSPLPGITHKGVLSFGDGISSLHAFYNPEDPVLFGGQIPHVRFAAVSGSGSVATGCGLGKTNLIDFPEMFGTAAVKATPAYGLLNGKTATRVIVGRAYAKDTGGLTRSVPFPLSPFNGGASWNPNLPEPLRTVLAEFGGLVDDMPGVPPSEYSSFYWANYDAYTIYGMEFLEGYQKKVSVKRPFGQEMKDEVERAGVTVFGWDDYGPDGKHLGQLVHHWAYDSLDVPLISRSLQCQCELSLHYAYRSRLAASHASDPNNISYGSSTVHPVFVTDGSHTYLLGYLRLVTLTVPDVVAYPASADVRKSSPSISSLVMTLGFSSSFPGTPYGRTYFGVVPCFLNDFTGSFAQFWAPDSSLAEHDFGPCLGDVRHVGELAGREEPGDHFSYNWTNGVITPVDTVDISALISPFSYANGQDGTFTFTSGETQISGHGKVFGHCKVPVEDDDVVYLYGEFTDFGGVPCSNVVAVRYVNGVPAAALVPWDRLVTPGWPDGEDVTHDFSLDVNDVLSEGAEVFVMTGKFVSVGGIEVPNGVAVVDVGSGTVRPAVLPGSMSSVSGGYGDVVSSSVESGVVLATRSGSSVTYEVEVLPEKGPWTGTPDPDMSVTGFSSVMAKFREGQLSAAGLVSGAIGPAFLLGVAKRKVMAWSSDSSGAYSPVSVDSYVWRMLAAPVCFPFSVSGGLPQGSVLKVDWTKVAMSEDPRTPGTGGNLPSTDPSTWGPDVRYAVCSKGTVVRVWVNVADRMGVVPEELAKDPSFYDGSQYSIGDWRLVGTVDPYSTVRALSFELPESEVGIGTVAFAAWYPAAEIDGLLDGYKGMGESDGMSDSISAPVAGRGWIPDVSVIRPS